MRSTAGRERCPFSAGHGEIEDKTRRPQTKSVCLQPTLAATFSNHAANQNRQNDEHADNAMTMIVGRRPHFISRIGQIDPNQQQKKRFQNWSWNIQVGLRLSANLP